jgi:hypothetical protein
MAWKVTERFGSEVERCRCSTLDEAMAKAAEALDRALDARGVGPVKAIRTYEPEQVVAARIEVSGPGFFRSAEAGVDVMGDGKLVPYRGAIRKEELQAGSRDEVLQAIRAAVEGPA